MRARGALARCAARATLVKRDGATSLEIRVEDGSCVVPITGLAAPTVGTVEVYGGVPTTWVAVERCKTRTIPCKPRPPWSDPPCVPRNTEVPPRRKASLASMPVA